VPMSVMGEVMTSSPGLTPTAARAACMAAVPELEATACLTPRRRANSASNSLTLLPYTLLSLPDLRTSSTSLTSSPIALPLASSTVGRGLVIDGLPPYLAGSAIRHCGRRAAKNADAGRAAAGALR